MGIGFNKLSSGSSYKKDSRNPNPNLFEIIRGRLVGHLLIAELKYSGCTNYEGRKILVFDGYTQKEFMSLWSVDPHFCEGSKLIARFAPTEKGWDHAYKFAIAITEPSRDEDDYD